MSKHQETPVDPLSLSSMKIALSRVTASTIAIYARKLGMELVDLNDNIIDAKCKSQVQARMVPIVSESNKDLKGASIVVSCIDSQDGSSFGVGVKLEGEPISPAHLEKLEQAKKDLHFLLLDFVEVIIPRSQLTGKKSTLLEEAGLDPRRATLSDLLSP
jgi:hypothetical protein